MLGGALVPLAVVIDEMQSGDAPVAAHSSSRTDFMASGHYSVKCRGYSVYLLPQEKMTQTNGLYLTQNTTFISNRIR